MKYKKTSRPGGGILIGRESGQWQPNVCGCADPSWCAQSYYAQIYLGSAQNTACIKSNNDGYLRNQIIRGETHPMFPCPTWRYDCPLACAVLRLSIIYVEKSNFESCVMGQESAFCNQSCQKLLHHSVTPAAAIESAGIRIGGVSKGGKSRAQTVQQQK